jgi:hypothetical protein
MTLPVYTIHARPDGAWRALEVPELRGVQVEVDDPAIAGVIEAQARMREQLDQMVEAFRTHQRAAIEKLRTEMELPMRDVGRLLDVSHQRVSQIVSETQDRVSKGTKDLRDRAEAQVRDAVDSVKDATRPRDKV